MGAQKSSTVGTTRSERVNYCTFWKSQMERELTTADVYDQASQIGQDIEKIFDRFGHDVMIDLMPKIIRVLEQLEILVGEREKDKQEVAELKLENERLYLEVKREANQRRKLDEELYQALQSGETQSLKNMIGKLQQENQTLRREYELSAQDKPVTAYISAPGDAEVMKKMKETIDSQRDNIRSKNTEMQTFQDDLEAMEEQVERLVDVNERLRKNLNMQQTRVNTLAKEKAQLQAEIQTLKQEMNWIKTGEEQEADENGEETNSQESEKLDGLEDEDSDEASEKKGSGHEVGTEETENGEDWELVQGEKKENALNNGTSNEDEAPDMKDPNRPRYTRKELEDVLFERNKLKEEVFALKEELIIYKPLNETQDSTSAVRSSPTPAGKEEKRDESGISKIFNIFTRKADP